MKTIRFVALCVFLLFLQSCFSTSIYRTDQDYIQAGKEAYKEYRSEHRLMGVKNTESKYFALTEQYYQKAYELNPNSFTAINEFLQLYWDESLPDKFFYWIDVLNNTENDKYSNYVYSANYCINIAKRTNADIYLENVNYDYSKINYSSYPETYDYEYAENIKSYAWENGKKNFGVKLWEKAIECLDKAYQIKQTNEVLNLYYEVYKSFSKNLRFAAYTHKGLKVTDLTLSVLADMEKANDYLNQSISLRDNWESHYKIYKQKYSVGYYDENFEPINAPLMWELKNKNTDIFKELDKAIELADEDNKGKLIFEKANVYFYSFRDYDKAKEEYNIALSLNYKVNYITRQINNCDKQKKNDEIYSKCASILGLNSVKDYLSWSSRTNYNYLYRYLNIGSNHQSYEYNDIILMPEQRLSIIDVSYENGQYVYLISSQGANQLSQCCKIISPVQLNYVNFHEYLITDVLLLKYIGEDAYKSYGNILRCDLFQNIPVGTKEFDIYKNKLLQIDELEKQIIK